MSWFGERGRGVHGPRSPPPPPAQSRPRPTSPSPRPPAYGHTATSPMPPRQRLRPRTPPRPAWARPSRHAKRAHGRGWGPATGRADVGRGRVGVGGGSCGRPGGVPLPPEGRGAARTEDSGAGDCRLAHAHTAAPRCCRPRAVPTPPHPPIRRPPVHRRPRHHVTPRAACRGRRRLCAAAGAWRCQDPPGRGRGGGGGGGALRCLRPEGCGAGQQARRGGRSGRVAARAWLRTPNRPPAHTQRRPASVPGCECVVAFTPVAAGAAVGAWLAKAGVVRRRAREGGSVGCRSCLRWRGPAPTSLAPPKPLQTPDRLEPQAEAPDLGARLTAALLASLARGARAAVIVGSDIPDLEAADVSAALQALDAGSEARLHVWRGVWVCLGEGRAGVGCHRQTGRPPPLRALLHLLGALFPLSTPSHTAYPPSLLPFPDRVWPRVGRRVLLGRRHPGPARPVCAGHCALVGPPRPGRRDRVCSSSWVVRPGRRCRRE